MKTTVKNQLIKIAYENPELRNDLLRVITASWMDEDPLKFVNVPHHPKFVVKNIRMAENEIEKTGTHIRVLFSMTVVTNGKEETRYLEVEIDPNQVDYLSEAIGDAIPLMVGPSDLDREDRKVFEAAVHKAFINSNGELWSKWEDKINEYQN